MLRSKRGPALFDYLTAGDNGGDAPLRPRSGPGPSASGSSGVEPEAARSRSPKPTPDPVVIARAPVSLVAGTEGKSPSGATRTWIEMDDERIRVSFSSLTAAAAVFVLLMVMLAAFEFGKRRGESAGVLRGFEEGKASLSAGAADDLETVRQQPPSSEIVRSLLRDPGATGAAGTTNPSVASPGATGKIAGNAPKKSGAERWTQGKTYVVVQEFAADKEEFARRAQGFLASKSIPTAIVSGAAGSFRLITTEGFNRQDAAERRVSEQTLARIHALGEDYYRDGGGYKLQGYFATLKGDGW